jgi:hypothetical protein
MTKHIAHPVVFEMRITTHYAQPVSRFDSELQILETVFKRPKEVAYEEFPENHSRFQAFLGISHMLEDAATKYDAKWTMEKVRKEVSEDNRLDKDLGSAHLDGAYADLLYQVGTLTSSVAAAIALLKVMQPSLVQWLKNRGPRTLHVKIGTSEISVQGEQDIKKVIELLNNIASDKREKPHPKREKALLKKLRKNQPLLRKKSIDDDNQ